jgi:hypothetical protein
MATAAIHVAFQGKPPGVSLPVSAHLLMLAIHVGVGPLLICFAPRISAWFYTPRSDIDSNAIRVGPRDVYRIACFVLGVYLLVQTAAPVSRIALAAIQDPRSVWMQGQLVNDALVVAVNTSAGLFLIFGSMPISKFLSNTTDAVGVPPHRLTIIMMITMLGVFAGILALLRLAAHSRF